MLAASIATKVLTIGTSGFAEFEGKEIIVDVWGCSTSATTYAPTNLNLVTYSFPLMNMTVFNCNSQVITG